MKRLVAYIILCSGLLYSAVPNPNVDERTGWVHNTSSNTALEPSNIKYFKYLENLPDEVTLKIFDDLDLSTVGDKKLFVGYGVIDQKGDSCRLFPASQTGYDVNTTICLPWWRVEREYVVDSEPVSAFASAVETLPQPKPPVMVNVCDKYADEKTYPGGKTTCVSYYDKLAGGDCFTNPEQSQCFVSTCGQNLKDKCTFVDVTIGANEQMESAISSSDESAPALESTRVKLTTHQYECPPGPIAEEVVCEDEKNVLMFPEVCEPDDPSTPVDDGVYEYCDEDRTIRDASNQIIGFEGTCANGTPIQCKVNTFANEVYECKDPVYEEYEQTDTYNQTLTRTFDDFEVDVLSGQPDVYSVKDECLRTNTVAEAREQELFIDINADGFLDDDIYILRHRVGGSHYKIYCNMQHANMPANSDATTKACMDSAGLSFSLADATNANNCALNASVYDDATYQACLSPLIPTATNPELLTMRTCATQSAAGDVSINYNGSILQCERNNGTYTYSETNIPLEVTDILSVQQTNETYFLSEDDMFQRSVAGGTEVKINGEVVTPPTTGDIYPTRAFEVAYGTAFASSWDNATYALTLLFPFSGIYELAFYNANGDEVVKTTIEEDDFNSIGSSGYIRLNLADKMQLSPNVDAANAGLHDDWVEWGGGVYTGKDSKTGAALDSPDDAWVKNNAITNVFIKDLQTGDLIPIPLVMPLPHPNMVFVSKVSAYEKRKYRCYNDFPVPTIAGQVDTKYVCEDDAEWDKFKNSIIPDPVDAVFWDNNALCEQNCVDRFNCTEGNPGEWLCNERQFENIGGDLGGALFSDEAACGVACNIQKNCETHDESSCNITLEEVNTPVSDFTGKTIFSRKDVSYACSSKKLKQTGCAEYERKEVSGTLDYDLSSVGVKKLNPIGFEKASTKEALLKMPKHIFSGWQGKCHYGMKMDFSFMQNPMTIMSYAMSAMSSYTQLANASPFEGMADNFTSWMGDGATKITDNSELLQDAIDLKDGVTELLDVPLYQAQVGGINFVDITYGSVISFGVNTAITLTAPTEEQYQLANDILEGYAGIENTHSAAYNSCMASIGLSFPNLVSWTFDNNVSSEQMLEPYLNPISLTTAQLAQLAQEFGEDWVMANYLINTDDPLIAKVLAVTPRAYIQAGQSLCTNAKVSAAMNQIQDSRTGSSITPGGGGNIGVTIGMAAISAACPICGFAGKVVMDLYTNVVATMNTCTDEEDAFGASDITEYKTYTFSKHEQCSEVNTECSKEMFWGDCVQWRKNKCCYDQITTKVFAEGLREQLDRPWGDCKFITIEDLNNVSFQECGIGEDPKVDKCIDTSKYSEFKRVLFRQSAKGIQTTAYTQGMVDQIEKAMATE